MIFEVARSLGERLLREWQPFVVLGDVAGSIRRRKWDENGLVGDVDLVVLPSDAIRLHAEFDKVFGAPKTKKASGNRRSALIDGVQVDVIVTTEEEWGAALLHSTGSAKHNIWLRGQAKGRGWLLSEKGLWDGDGERIVAPDEVDIFNRLGLGWIAPEDRER